VIWLPPLLDGALQLTRAWPVAGLPGSGARDSRYFFNARLVPASAGALAVKITRGQSVLVDRTFAGRVQIKLDTRRLTSYHIRAEVLPIEGYAGTVRVLRANVVLPRLALGARGVAVSQLGGQLQRLHYAAPSGSNFDGRMLDAVYAFQKVHGLPRTGVVDTRFWHALSNPRVPIPRFRQPGGHIEVNKSLQVLYVVRSARVALIVPISMFRHYARKFDVAYLREQVYLEPHPKELMLRNHV